MISEHLEDYFTVRCSQDSTQVQYRIAARLFDRWASDNDLRSLDDVTGLTLSRFLEWYETQVSSNTVRSKRRTLLALLRFLGKDIDSRRVRLVRRRPKLIDSWTVKECQTLIYAATKLTGSCGKLGTSRGEYTACMLAVVYETALRRGDLESITSKDVRRGQWLQLQNKTGTYVDCQLSNATRSRVVSMPHFKDHGPFAGWTHDHKRTLSNLATSAMETAWLESCDGKPLQKLRRSSITIQEQDTPGTGYQQAGHTTDAVTKQSYIDRSSIARNRPTATWAAISRAG